MPAKEGEGRGEEGGQRAGGKMTTEAFPIFSIAATSGSGKEWRKNVNVKRVLVLYILAFLA